MKDYTQVHEDIFDSKLWNPIWYSIASILNGCSMKIHTGFYTCLSCVVFGSSTSLKCKIQMLLKWTWRYANKNNPLGKDSWERWNDMWSVTPWTCRMDADRFRGKKLRQDGPVCGRMSGRCFLWSWVRSAWVFLSRRAERWAACPLGGCCRLYWLIGAEVG